MQKIWEFDFTLSRVKNPPDPWEQTVYQPLVCQQGLAVLVIQLDLGTRKNTVYVTGLNPDNLWGKVGNITNH